MMRRMIRNRKGQGLVEYALIIAGVALIAAVGVSVFGHKVSDMIASTAAVLPGAHADDNGPIVSGKLIETTSSADGPIALDIATISGITDQPRLGNNIVGPTNGATFSDLVIEAADN